ncbi:MAG TPA: DUF2304 domain-containing protein [Candidatus Omnitrophota bacterium]|nr:DUF2304 domain-containing protein [Candidatus Omnitrophota bacterium]HPS37300.1 DUF2304 domain-containing protein [Candidatus Omnitrophota bacterium]
MQPKTFAIFMTALILIFVLDLIRRQKMTFKYALSWLVSSLLVLVFAIREDWVRALATWAGFILTSNFIFFLVMLFVLFLSLLLTIYMNEQNSRTEALTQAIAKLDVRMKKLEKEGSKNP